MISFHIDPLGIIQALGYVGIFLIVFAESGVFVGFFLPGDSLLITAGLLATQGSLSLAALLVLVPVAAILGDSVGYSFGRYIGPRLFTKEDSFLFNRRHVERSREFYKRYGARAILFARFAPVIRTFVPIVAGVGEMRYPTFLIYNAVGGCLWSAAFLLAGYFLGKAIPNLDNYILLIVAVVIAVSILPIVWEWRKEKRK